MVSLRTKYFLMILAVNIALAGCIYLFLTVSFEKAFTQYLNQRELIIAERFSTDLETYYTENRGWGQLATHPMAWEHMLRLQFRRRQPIMQRRQETRLSRKPDSFIPFFPRNAGAREERPQIALPQFFLLDANKQHMAGSMAAVSDASLQPLTPDGAVVGYLGIPSNPAVRDYLDRDFASAFGKNFMAILGLALVVALLAAIPLSHMLVKRIRQLAAQVKKITLGDYQGELIVAGHDELGALAQDINELRITLDSNVQERKQWTADISHELRTPIAVLKADLESMQDGVRPMDAAAIMRLQSHVDRLKQLIGDLHELSLTDLGSMSYRKENIELNTLVIDCVAYMEDQFADAGLQFHAEVDSHKMILLYADKHRLQQVVVNLLTNALRYTNAPGQVKLALTQTADNAVLTICDSAPGVEPSLLPHLTRRLFRVDNSRNRQTGGSGLGLTLCANILKAHNGEMTFTNNQLGGLTVTVNIPLRQRV